MQLQEEMLGYGEALDNLHLDIVLQLLQAGADVQAITAQVKPAVMLCISAVSLSSHNSLGRHAHSATYSAYYRQYVQPSPVHVCCLHCPNMQALH